MENDEIGQNKIEVNIEDKMETSLNNQIVIPTSDTNNILFHPGTRICHKNKNKEFKEFLEKKRKKLQDEDTQKCPPSIKLFYGEELFFDNKLPLLLNYELEQDVIVRRIIQIIPRPIKERLIFFSKFLLPNLINDNKFILYNYYINLRNKVFSAYYKEYKLRNAFRKLLQLYRIKKLDKAYIPEIDPITLSELQKPIIIYDWELKRKYAFEASSLANSIESSLTYNEFMFSFPQNPKNPKSNKIFTYSQLISIYYQLINYKEIRWTIISLKENNFNVSVWHLYNRSQLFRQTLKREISCLDTANGRDLFLEFIELIFEECNIDYNEETLKTYEKAVINEPNHWYLQKFKPFVILFNEYKYFDMLTNKNRLKLKLTCLKIMKYHGIFLGEMLAKNYSI